MRYRHDIEGLRAVAVVAVLLYHFGVPGMGGGYVGVDVFFVISGYLITSLLIDERQNSGRISIGKFYARRARRLLPISTTVLVTTAVSGAIWLSATRLKDLADDVTAAAVFGANILFAHRGTNYLTANLAPSPLRHYWSLAVEEQFYFVWPALIALVTIGAVSARRRVAWAMGAIVVASFAASVALTPGNPSWSYFGLHTRAWELGVGALLAALAPQTDRISRPVRAAAAWAGLAALIISVVTFGSVTEFPGWVAALPVLGTGAMLAGCKSNPLSPAMFLKREPFLYLGERSYSLYLWHWPVLVIAEAHLERTLRFGEKVAALALVFLLAELGYRFIEDPIRSSRPLAARMRASLVMGALLVCVSLLVGETLARYHPDLSTGVVAAAPSVDVSTTAASVPDTTTPSDTALATTTTVPVAPAPISMTDTQPLQAIIDAVPNNVVPDNVRPPVLSAFNDTGIIYANGCHQYYDTTIPPTCVFGDPNGKVTVAIWGDSHAAQWFPALDSIGKERGWRVLALTQGGCPYLDVEVYNNHDKSVFHHCGPWREAVRAYLREQHADVVFMSQFYALTEAASGHDISIEDWNAKLPEVITSLRADGIEPVVIADVPNPPKDVPSCVAEHRHQTSTCNASPDAPFAQQVDDAIRTITSASGVSLIEPEKWVCSGGTCPVIVGDLLMYRDGDHFTKTFVEWLTPVFEALVAPFVEGVAAYKKATAG